MSLTRKHYEQFAQRFAEISAIVQKNEYIGAPGYSAEAQEAAQGSLRALAHKMSTDFLLDNPRFDRQRFLRACGF